MTALLLTRHEVVALLGISLRTFQRHVQPDSPQTVNDRIARAAEALAREGES